MKSIIYNVPQYQDVGGKGEEVIRMFKGLNSYDPLSIPSNFFTELENLGFDDFPSLTSRLGTELVLSSGFPVIGLGVWKGLELHIINSNGLWRAYNGTTWKTVLSGINTNGVYSFTNFQGNLSDINLFLCNGSSGLYKYDGTTGVAYGNAPADINFITTYQNRLWGISKGNTLHASRLDNASAWQTFNAEGESSFFKTIESERGEKVTMLSGGLSKLVIGLPNSVRELYGALPQDFADKSVSEGSGFINNMSHTTYNGTLYGVHNTGIYSYSGGTLPNKNEYDVVGKFNYDLNTAKGAVSFGNNVMFVVGGNILSYNKKSEVNAWTLLTGLNANLLIEFKEELYIVDNVGNVKKLKGTTDLGSPVTFKAVSKVFTNNSIANKQRLYKMYISVNAAAGTNIKVYLSSSINGNDWELVSDTMGNGAQTQRILVPVGKFALDNFIRIKIEGTGNIKIYEINRQFRTMPLV